MWHQAKTKILLWCFFITLMVFTVSAQQPKVKYTISVKNRERHLFHISLQYDNEHAIDTVDLYMPRWTPGYYQILEFGNRLSHLEIKNENGKILYWKKISPSHWQVYTSSSQRLHIQYEMLEDSSFVAQSFVDTTHAFILPSNLFLYTSEIHYKSKISLSIYKHPAWPKVYATGMDLYYSDNDKWIFHADNLDAFYDSPILLGRLDSLSSYTIDSVIHEFIGYNLGDGIYRDSLMLDLKKIITEAIRMFGDIPYHKYVFLGIGEGHGGIEHINSSAVSFNLSNIKTRKDYLRTLSFLAHEYFHHFNVKGLRPIELGPFDYQHENRTHQLWISEGLSVYYEHWLLYKAGIYTYKEFLDTFAEEMGIYENKPGHLVQSLASSSWNTWSDGPFGNLSDTAISYYDKGPVIGLLFDCAIYHYSLGKYTLEDVMKYLYDNYYKKWNRGFTEKEFEKAAVKFGTMSILPLFDYIYTAAPIDYNKYLQWRNLSLEVSNETPYIFILRQIKKL